LGQQASALIRLAAPPTNLPNYINLENTSDWATTALLSAGFESSTLPTRFNATARKRGSLALFEDVLNTNGKQNLFELHASVNNPSYSSNDHGSDHLANGNSAASADPSSGLLDIDYSPSRNSAEPLARKAYHIFGQVESERDTTGSNTSALMHTPEERLRRRLDDESVVEM
jgi:hypothetical protein